MKKVIKAVSLTISALALATTASAADVNIYGASAQFNFWNDKAPHFLTSVMGCANTIQGTATSKEGMTLGTNCSGTLPTAGGDIAIRYTSNKSVEGPRAVAGLDPLENDSCSVNTPSGDYNRHQANYDPSTQAFFEDCLPVNAGCSDVASESFTQESHGWKNGSYDFTQFDEVLDPTTIPGDDTLKAYQPVAVPFSFYANNSLELNEINRQQALLLFSGNVYNYSQFGSDYPNKKVVLCMRHAGSGTHATLDKAIMRGDTFLPTNQKVGIAPMDPIVPAFLNVPGIMFHESSSNLMDCVDDNGTYPTATAGAIGYADSDKAIDFIAADGTENVDARYINTKRLGYNNGGEGMTPANYTAYGYSALKNEIINGSYEFWSSQWCYTDETTDTSPAAVENRRVLGLMMTYAGTAANMVCIPGTDERGCYWSALGELNVTKEKDTTVPHF